MYSSVWNRVALLAAGMAIGWNLVNLMVVPADAKRAQAIKVCAGAVVGIAVIVTLAVSNAAAATMGVLIFGISALVAYAGNARHACNVPPILPLLQPARPLDRDPRQAMLIVHPGEPAQYDGPLPWAHRLVRRAKEDQPIPHWFVQPRLMSRVRSAVDNLPSNASINAALAELVDTLAGILGDDDLVQLATLTCEPYLVKQLTALAEDGYSRVTLVALGLDPADMELVRAEVMRSRVREVGLRVEILDASPSPLPDTYGPRFDALQRGETPETFDVPVTHWAHALAGQIRALGNLDE